MTDVLGDSPEAYYTKEQAKLYNLSGAFERIQKRMTLNALSIIEMEENSKVLDLGCGTGFSTEVIKKAGFNVTGCDVNKNMLYYAKKKGLKVVECDARSLPFKEKEFDYVISISTIQWVKPKDYSLILEEINRVTKKSAIIQFYPKSEEEFNYFAKIAKKNFSVKIVSIGESHKLKKYVMLKKRK